MSRPSPRRRPVASGRDTRGDGRRRPVVPTLGRAAVVVLAAGLATGGACGGDTADPPPTTSPPGPGSTVGTIPPATAAPATSTTTSVPADEAEIRAVIDRYWDAWFAATAYPPDPDNPELNAVLTGDARTRIIGGVQRWKDNDQYVRLPSGSRFSHATTAISFGEGGVVVARECVVDDSEVVSMATGAVSEAGLAALTVVTSMKEFDDGWRITTREIAERVEGSETCASE